MIQKHKCHIFMSCSFRLCDSLCLRLHDDDHCALKNLFKNAHILVFLSSESLQLKHFRDLSLSLFHLLGFACFILIFYSSKKIISLSIVLLLATVLILLYFYYFNVDLLA